MPACVVALLAFASVATAHMSIWTESMYGVGHNGPGTPYYVGTGPTMNFSFEAGDPVNPIGPNLATQDEWWFRGPAARALPPMPGAVSMLPAGGTWEVDITCHPAWSNLGWRTTNASDEYSNCPNSPGPYHADPNALMVNPSLIQGCALGIADVDDIEDVTRDNLAIFSVQPDCVAHRQTYFDIPAQMPKCTGSKCICAWFWEPATGIANFYMTAFDCNIANAQPSAPKVSMNLTDPQYCPPAQRPCPPQLGAKRPIYAYNSDPNVPWIGNEDRVGYLPHWGYTPGAQVDIFATSTSTSSIASSTVLSTTTSMSTSTMTSTSVVTTTSAVANRRTKQLPPASSSSTAAAVPTSAPDAQIATKELPPASTTPVPNRRTKQLPPRSEPTGAAGAEAAAPAVRASKRREHPRQFSVTGVQERRSNENGSSSSSSNYVVSGETPDGEQFALSSTQNELHQLIQNDLADAHVVSGDHLAAEGLFE